MDDDGGPPRKAPALRALSATTADTMVHVVSPSLLYLGTGA